jgi:hypothetical protein
MRLGRQGVARQPVSPPAPRAVPPPKLELVTHREVRRKRPVAILKVPRFWSASGRAPAAAEAFGPAKGLDAFPSESAPIVPIQVDAPNSPAPARPGFNWASAAKTTAVILVTAALAVAGVFGVQSRLRRTATTGTVTIETNPAGLDLSVDGKPLGKTPLTTVLASGSHDLQVGTIGDVRNFKIDVSAGTAIVQRVEFAERTVAAAPTTGGLRVQTEPAQLTVLVDGTPRGLSPVAIESLLAGDHEISVRTATGIVRRSVSVKPGETLSLLLSSPAPSSEASAAAGGWLMVSSPVALRLREGGKVIGTSETERLMLPAGDHEIEFDNEALGFAVRKTVRVAAGRMAAAKIDVPNGILSINAQPWAEVWVDGERIGETPIGNLPRRIGSHEVVLRHPEFGERRQTVVILVDKPTRIGVDLRK